jgi:class 3 adenylate cyclase
MTRRLAAIVAADVVEYSRLMGEDEFGTVAAVNRLREDLIAPLVIGHGGRIFKLVGDGVLMEFASATDAMLCAIAIQTKIAQQRISPDADPPLSIRIGVNVGDILIEQDDIYGDAVNIAVRLEELAMPDTICLSESVLFLRNSTEYNFIPLGERLFKHISKPVAVWKWEPPTSHSSDKPPDGFGSQGKYVFKGQHILDPRVTDLLLKLHMRSARLALSDAFDDIIQDLEEGQKIGEPDTYAKLGEQLNEARGLLACIFVERVEDHGQYLADGTRHQSLGDFFESLTDSNRTAYTMQLVPEIVRILKSEGTVMEKRRKFMTLIDQFISEQYLPRARKVLKFAFTEQ